MFFFKEGAGSVISSKVNIYSIVVAPDTGGKAAFRVAPPANTLPGFELRDIAACTLVVTVSASRHSLRNFGVFQVQKRLARVGRNPRQPEKDVTIPDRAVVKFTAGKALKGQLAELDLGELE